MAVSAQFVSSTPVVLHAGLKDQPRHKQLNKTIQATKKTGIEHKHNDSFATLSYAHIHKSCSQRKLRKQAEGFTHLKKPMIFFQSSPTSTLSYLRYNFAYFVSFAKVCIVKTRDWTMFSFTCEKASLSSVFHRLILVAYVATDHSIQREK